jgi:hypothetical protein
VRLFLVRREQILGAADQFGSEHLRLVVEQLELIGLEKRLIAAELINTDDDRLRRAPGIRVGIRAALSVSGRRTFASGGAAMVIVVGNAGGGAGGGALAQPMAIPAPAIRTAGSVRRRRLIAGASSRTAHPLSPRP